MLRLNLTGKPETVELGEGARLFCDPIDHEVVVECLRDVGEEATNTELARVLGCRVVHGWEGIHDHETGKAIKFDADLLPRMMREPLVFRPFYADYAMRAFGVMTEGNVSSSSPSGDGRAETDIAEPAAKPARSAPRKSTSRARPKARRSGA